MAYSPLDFDAFVGRQIALARKAKGLTQEELSGKLGFKDRQILSNIEKGLRKVGEHDLTVLVRELGRSLDYFTDQYQLPEEQLFSWRIARDCPEEIEVECERRSRKLISAYMQFSDLQRRSPNPILPQLPLGRNSTYDEVSALAEYLASYWRMGDAPAKELVRTISGLNVVLFRVDVADEVSGASFRSDRLCAILVNRNHSLGRQHFSMAHELFHVLTWSVLPPEPVAPQETEEARSKAEKLANCFAGAILMPTGIVLPLWDSRGDCPLREWLEETASGLGVSPDALFWRLKSLRKVKVQDYPPHWDLPMQCESPLPKLYSRDLAEITRAAIEHGQVSVRRAAKLLSLDREGVAEFLEEHSLAMPYGM